MKIGNYLSLVKFSHTIFAMPFALVGFFLAIGPYNYSFDYMKLIYIVLCMIFARNSAMAFNRWADRKIDGENPRTSNRELPSKIITSRSAMIFTVVNSILFIGTTYLINTLCFNLSPLALLIILAYSYTKRFSFLAHLFLGLALSIAPVGAFIAVTGKFELPIFFLAATVLFWTAGFDIIYALQDEEFDRKNKLFSIPAKFGRTKSLIISVSLHVFCILFAIIWLVFIQAGFLAWLGLLIFSCLIVYQHTIIKPNDISRVNLAFGTTNGLASVLFAGFCISSFFVTL